MSDAPLAQRRCRPCEGGVEPLPASAAQALLRDVPGWELLDGKRIARTIVCILTCTSPATSA